METFLENTEVHFEMTVREFGDNYSWNEKLDSKKFGIPNNNAEAMKIAEETIEAFNRGLMPREMPRKLVNVQRIETKVIDLINQNTEE